MEEVAYLDTHAVIWLYAGRTDLFPETALSRIRGHALLVSPIVELELQYLLEIDRVTVPPKKILDELESEIGLVRCTLDFASVARKATGMKWTRDPFDRIIVAQAALNDALLVTKDQDILKHYRRAVWQ